MKCTFPFARFRYFVRNVNFLVSGPIFFLNYEEIRFHFALLSLATVNLFLSLPPLSLSFSVTLEERISRRLLLKLALFCQSRVHEEFHFYVDHVYASHGEACVYIYKRAYHFLHFANCCFCEVHDERITNQLPFANRSNLFMINK